MKAIVAVDQNWGIGKDGDLLVHLSGDLKYFKEQTLGGIIVIGRKTLESFPGARPLPGRQNIVLTRNEGYTAEGCAVCHSIAELESMLRDPEGSEADDEGALEKAQKGKTTDGEMSKGVCENTSLENESCEQEKRREVFVCGGGNIYRQLLPYCDEVLVTKIDAAFGADTFFPNLDEDEAFILAWSSEEKTEKEIAYRFTKYVRA